MEVQVVELGPTKDRPDSSQCLDHHYSNQKNKNENEINSDFTSTTLPPPPSCSNFSCRQLEPPLLGNWDSLLVEEDASSSAETCELGHISIVKCISCHKFLGLLQDKSTFYTEKAIFANENATSKTDGWHKIESIWEQRVLFVLNQVIYKDYEEPDEALICEFAFPPSTDLIKILWVNTRPVGFYSVKLKGTLDPYMMEWYAMTTLDTLFIQKENRGQGWGSSAVKDLLLDFPSENIGFSFPISIPMSRVLHKYLHQTPSDRNRFWEITGCGTEGNTRNLWLMFQRQLKSRTTTTTLT